MDFKGSADIELTMLASVLIGEKSNEIYATYPKELLRDYFSKTH